MPPRLDLTNQIFGRLKVIEATEKRCGGSIVWRCQCACIGKIITYVSTNDLRSGHTKSCGCLQRERVSETHTRHGASKVDSLHPLYIAWKARIRRCYNKNTKDYKDYGGRGIKVYKPWHQYENFRDYALALPNCPDNAQIPNARMSLELDRIDNDKDYEPGNLKWSTRTEQNNNKRSNRMIMVNGEMLTFKIAVNRYGKASYDTIRRRIDHLGWSLKRAFLTP